MKTIIAGGRNYKFTVHDITWLNRLMHTMPITHVVSGGASGADRCGEAWAKKNNLPVTIYRADWAKYGKAAGPIRNQNMAYMADALIAFPGGRGTKDMIERARAREMKVIVMDEL